MWVCQRSCRQPLVVDLWAADAQQRRTQHTHTRGLCILSLITATPPCLLVAPLSAAAWEGLASCYQNLGRFTAALKAYTRSLQLQPGRPYSRIQVRAACLLSHAACMHQESPHRCAPPMTGALFALALLPLQCGAIHMALGSPANAIGQYEAALSTAPAHPAALLGAAEALAASAAVHSRQGALG